MKKLLFALIAFTMLTTSCYKKDFENLNTKIDANQAATTAAISALSSQVTSIAGLVAGIPALQTSINNLQTSVTAIGTSLTALTATVNTINGNVTTINGTVNAIKTSVDGLTTNLTALTATVNTINTNLNTLATNVAANQVTTVGLLNDIKNQATANQTALVNLINSTKTALETAITTGNTNVINTLTGTINSAKTALEAAIAASQAAVIANATTNTTNIIDAVNAAATATQQAIQLQINVLKGQLETAIANGNAAVIAQLQADIATATTTLNNAITSAQAAIIADNANQTAILSGLINTMSATLQAALAIANAQLATLVNSNNFFIGNLTITNEAELVAAEALGAKVRVITGNVLIDATTFSSAQLARLKNVTNNTDVLPAPQVNPWIGSVKGNVTVRGTNAIDLSKLLLVDGNVDVNSTIDGGAGHNLSSLVSITGNYTVGADAVAAGADPSDNALQTVGGAMFVKHQLGYSYPNLTTVTGTLTAYNLTAASPNRTTIISFPALTSNVNMNDGDGGANGDLTYNLALSVTIGASSGLTSLTANAATFITLGEDVYTGGNLSVSSTSATAINMQTMTGGNGSLTINTPMAATVNLSGLVTLNTGAITITTEDSSPAGTTPGTVDLSNYTGLNNNFSITITGPNTLNLPKFLGRTSNHDVNSTTIKTMTLGAYEFKSTADLNGMSVLENLTVSGVLDDVSAANLNEGPLKNLTLTANHYDVDVDLADFENLLTLSSAGTLKRIHANNCDKLTTVTTAGTTDYFWMIDNPLLVTINYGHSFYNDPVGAGTNIKVINNDLLVNFSTGSTGKRLKYLEVADNAVLATVNFSSFVAGDNITAGAITVHVYNNALEGTYTQSVFATNTPPVMVQSGLSTLKAYVLNLYSQPSFYTVSLDLGYNTGAGTTDNISGTLDADRAAHIAAGGAANGSTSFVQRHLDEDGAVGSRIGVARELTYLQ